MKTSLMLVSAVVLCALSTGCANVNLARRGCNSCTSCSAKAGGCDQVACSGVASTGPAGVMATGGAGVAATGDPAAVAATPGPYDPGMYGGYGGYGNPGMYGGGGYGHFGHRGGYGAEGGYGGPPSAQVAYPYYTTRGPRDFLINNPPSIGY